jgi:anaerobic ribonucleoside-triphosphate reductase activating protein
MLKYYNFDIVCQEIPDEVTLAINITNCPIHCHGCHSPWLWKDIGNPLTDEALAAIIDRYADDITCVCIMGGDGEPEEVERTAKSIKAKYPSLAIGWYSGREQLPEGISPTSFQYVKLGPYVESVGGLRSPHTNQKIYRIASDGTLIQIRLNTPGRFA